MKKTLIAAALGTAATAEGFFGLIDENIEAGAIIELGQVTATAPGVVEIYEFNAGEIGALLGTETVAAGANLDVRVNVGAKPATDVLAVLKVDGAEADRVELDVIR